ncbi:hypothetical protein [Methylomagnum ishizawai]|uniref:hypothetical protein n=1 Tax=Methylomagnum ishizawai TaxID=1760988 RepID=UPI001C32DF9D|nr:hypothetical protein [Methylomagnum ishizawai]BBL76886.1 hypothetical protein MishRS11D_39840 [Methylomagnum ishizawai]
MTVVEAIRIAKERGFTPELQAVALDSGDPELAYRFAYAVEEADLDALETVVLRSPHPRLVFDFALVKAERGGDVARLQEAVVASGDAGLMILFAADVEGADIERLEDAVRAHPDAKYSLLFEAEMRQKGHY